MPATPLTAEVFARVVAAHPELAAFTPATEALDNDPDLATLKAALRVELGRKRIDEALLAEWDEQAELAEFGEVLEEHAEPEADDEEGESEGRSVVKRTYKSRYKPFKSTCGDELAQLVAGHLKVKTEDGVRIDTDRLRAFAVANECWQPGYSNLNVGMQRMNVVNRLRAKVKKGHDIVWA